MSWYRVRVAGRPLHVQKEDVERRFGFYVNQVVHAATEEAAREAAFRIVAARAKHRSGLAAPIPRLVVDDIAKMSWWGAIFARQQGFVLFPLPQDEALIADGSLSFSSWIQYDEARKVLADYLERDANLQASGQAAAIGAGYHELDDRLPRGKGNEWNKIFVALGLWDYWIDARNHAWEPFYGIAEEEWPVLARVVAADLAANREVTNVRVLELVC